MSTNPAETPHPQTPGGTELMTDATGRSFLSYRRSREKEAHLLLTAQHEVGIPTWQDLRDLGHARPTADELRHVLTDPQTANAVLWLTPEVSDSATIRDVEVPAIARRLDVGDAFFLVSCAAGGLDYAAAAALVQDRFGPHDLGAFNQCRITQNPLGPAEARRVAGRVLANRLQAVHRQLAADPPIELRLTTWHAPEFTPGLALDLDWSHHFDPHREAKRGAWEVLLPALATVREAIRKNAPGRRVEASGRLTLSAALALGAAFSALDSIPLAWSQVMPEGRGRQRWCLWVPREAAGLQAKIHPGQAGAKDLAVLISARDQVQTIFDATRAALPPFGAIVTIRRPEAKFQLVDLATPGQAVDVVETTIEALREARATPYSFRRIHLFLSAPAGLAVLLGQQLNTLGPVQLYEHIEAEGVYRPSVELRSAGAEPSATSHS